MTMSTLQRSPAQWGQDAANQHGWLHAFKVAKSCAKEFLGVDSGVRNPHYAYWAEVKKWILANAPDGVKQEIEELEKEENEQSQRKGTST